MRKYVLAMAAALAAFVAFQLRDVAVFVHRAAALEKLNLGIVRPVGLVDQASRSRPIQVGEMAALKKPNEVSGGNDQFPIAPMHRLTLVASRTRSRCRRRRHRNRADPCRGPGSGES